MIEDVYPLAPMQQGMLFHVIEAPANIGAYWAQGLYEFAGGLDVASFRMAWDLVVRRHAALRTGFVWQGVDEPLQVVMAGVTLPFEVLDWSGTPGEDEQRARLEKLIQADRDRGLDLTAPPLMRLYLISRGGGRHWLLWGMYQGLCDGWSLPIVMDEVSLAYAAVRQGKEPALPAVRPYREFIAWLGRRDLGDMEEFWRGYLDGFEAPTPLPVDRQATGHWDQDRRRVELSREATAGLERLARQARVTLGTVVQAGWALLLSRVSGESDVMFGRTVSGRPADLAGMESIVGLFINTLPMRVTVPWDETFTAWLRRLQDDVVRLQKYEHTPLLDIQRCSAIPRGTALFNSLVSFQNYPGLAGAEETGAELFQSSELLDSIELGNFPISVACLPGERMAFEVEYSTAAFDGVSVDRLMDRFTAVLTAVAADGGVLVRDVEVTLPGERELLVREWAEADVPVAGDVVGERALIPAHRQVAEWARRTPDELAVVCGTARLSFAELDARAELLAGWLRSSGVGPEVAVGVVLGRGVDLVVAFMAVLKCGGVYVPLNVGQPVERLGFMLEDCGASVLVSSTDLAGGLPPFAGPVLMADALGDEAPADAAAPVADVSLDGLAYMAFTSGSTGRPKGVGVTHRGLAGYVAGWGEVFDRLGGPGAMLSMAGAGFDVSVGDIVRAVAFGRAVVFTPQSDFVSVSELHQVLDEHQVEIAEIVPGSLLRELAGYCRDTGGLKHLRLVISGTDIWRHEALVASVADVAPVAIPANVYGVTEAAIDSLLMPLVPDQGPRVPPGDGFGAVAVDGTGLMVPVGRPLAGVRVYVVDEWLNVVPVGVTGELLVGGVGVARGYVGRAGLTSERFVADHLSGLPGQRLYRTGDRVRWRADGMLEFLGRTDEQVKIRGFRIEPGEIENVLAEHPSVQDAVVVAREDGPTGKRLVGYVVPEPGATAEVPELRAFLRARLPDYMVPAVMMVVESFTLTANGKVDRRALPEPDVDVVAAGVEYVPPRSEAEIALAGIWSDVLGVERVGVQDNFFELGGDSILSLQIIARARAAGLQLDVADVFARQSVGELALAVREVPVVVLAEQGTVAGPVPLTPIQHWFTEQQVPDRDHWNWSGMFELAPGIDAGRLARAVDGLVAHHDALRIRFTRDGDTWVQENAAEETAEVFSVVDAVGLPRERLEYIVTERMTAVQRSLSLSDGPLLRVTYFERGHRPGWLGIAVHHLVMDGVAWNVLLEDLHRLYESGGDRAALPRKTTSFRQWADTLVEFAGSAEARGEADHWLGQLTPGFAVPVDKDGRFSDATVRSVRVELDAEATSALLTRVHRAYRTQINDVLLAGLLQALGRWAGTDAVTIDLESHGREAVADGVDLSRTVGWFTSIFPVALSGADLDDPAGVLKSVKEQLRSTPRRGVGYGALRYLTDPGDDTGFAATLERLRGAAGPQVLFNYTGGADAAGDDSVGLVAKELPVDLCGPTGETGSHALHIEAYQTPDGRMAFDWYHSTDLHHTETVQRVADAYVRALRGLIEHCLSPGAGGYTPSDFPLARLDQPAVDMLAETGSPTPIQDVYPLAPVQQGMLFHVLEAPADGAGVYWAQGLYELGGHRVDPDVMRAAWDTVVERHAALRTGFVWQGVAEPVQVVHEGIEVPFRFLDWSGLDDDEARQARLDDLLREDREQGFDLARPPLTRVYLIDRGDERYWLIWALFQGVCDGWSLPVVVEEVSRIYEGLRAERRAALPAVRPYRDFIAWLQGRDATEVENFWRTYLAGFEAPTPLPLDRQADEHWAQDHHRVRLSEEVTRGLVELSRRARVTLGTVVQAAWALLLSRYSGDRDVMFGLTVSGRPAELTGMESIVGLFINTLPMRIEVPGDVPFVEWLQRLQDNQVAIQRYEYTPLIDIQRESLIPRGTALFNSIVVFGNYPQEELPEEGVPTGERLLFTPVENVEQGHYPMTVMVDLEDRLGVEVAYSTAVFDAATVERVLGHLTRVLGAVAADPVLTPDAVEILDPAEHATLTAPVAVPEPAGAGESIVTVFEGWVRDAPDAVAVTGDGGTLTYAELDRRANRLAHLLIERGAAPGRLVAVALPRTVDLVVALLGVVKSGAGYLPIDPDYPADRVAFMLEDAQPVTMVTAELLAGSASYPSHAPGVAIGDRDVAYVIYTSGSTGRPKGVMIEHANVIRLLTSTQKWFDFGPDDVWSMFHSAAFDFSVWELWGALLWGGKVVVVSFETSRSPAAMLRLLADEGVTVLCQTPSAFYQLTAAEAEQPVQELPLRYVIFGGEALEVARLATWRERHPRVDLVNMYGITETTVHVSYLVVDDTVVEGDWRGSPVGVPIEDLAVYVLDERLSPAPIGVPGEMYVAGAGLARGYLGRAGLSATRFIADHVSGRPGQRLYRTGDRARWRADGNLEYLGRTDDQVKIRGFRIEPGEIENVLAEHPGVQHAVVVARDEGNLGKRLIGYAVPRPGAALEVADLREFVRDRLPDYMVPAVFMIVESFSLTTNGKIDRRALPEPDARPAVGAPFVAPATEAETILAGIWSEVLGVERVGVRDNFFELGGDSILSLQIVARARAAGLRLDVADVFARQSVAELAMVVRDAQGTPAAEQGTVSGPVPLTPIQHWFTRLDLADRDHWNWSDVLELAPGTDPAALSRAFGAVIAHHDALRMRLKNDDGTWVQVNSPDERAEVFEVVDAAGLDQRALEQLVTERMTALQTSLSLAGGPLLRVLCFDRGDRPAWLGVTVHHLVMDEVSWNVLLQDLEQAYRAVAGKGSAEGALPDKTTSFKRWAEGLREFAGADETRAELPYWLGQLDNPFSLPVDTPGAAATGASTGVVRVWLDAGRTSSLLTGAHKAYRTQINDLLLAALLRALGQWAGTGAVTIDLESHGREAVAEGMDLSRTVGWFTSIFPVALSSPDLDDLAALIPAVKEQLRSSPRRGVGYGALRYLADPADREIRRLQSLPAPAVSFNYLGGTDATQAAGTGLVARTLPPALAGRNVSEERTRPHLLGVEAAQTTDGRMVFEWYYSADVHRQETVERLAARYLEALERIIEHCLNPQAGTFTPSDFPLAGLDADSLAAIMRQSEIPRG
ncbi:amino acid adenylation domain-containing protein [Sphaerisporangium aureirubrum]|uniref:Amino acid adenylation domain-containing protein n=1 Tax=Sphaerisporangium aureirubrum TaxID=1544736 RepID=A0ABW1NH84_9ACTN